MTVCTTTKEDCFDTKTQSTLRNFFLVAELQKKRNTTAVEKKFVHGF